MSHKRYAENKLNVMRIIVGAPEEMYQEQQFNQLLGVDQVGKYCILYSIKISNYFSLILYQ